MIPDHLRPYQITGVDAVFEAWENGINEVLLDQATGTGKTVAIAEIVRRAQPKRALILAHRRELVKQGQNKIEKFTGLRVEIEMGKDRYFAGLFDICHALVSSVQSQTPGRRSKPTDFDLLIVDECFVAGTLVGNKPIQDICIGDMVETHHGRGMVTHTFKSRPSSLVSLLLSDGRRINCTPNHPFWTPRGFITASELTNIDMVLTIMPYESMCNMSVTGKKQTVRQAGVPVGVLASNDSQHAQKSRRGDYSLPKNKRDAQSSNARVGFNTTSCDGVEADCSRRERNGANNSTAGVGGGVGMGNGARHSYRNKETQRLWLSDLLQGGCWQLGSQDSGGSGWELTLTTFPPRARRKERRIASFARVVGVEIIKRGSKSRFAEVCPDGFVYNLETSNGHTYFANGVLVHNCHHVRLKNKSYMDVINHYRQNPNLKILGVTATVEPGCLGVFKKIVFSYPILQAITEGYLVNVEQQMVTIHGLDYSHIRTTAGDLNGADLAAVVESEKVCQGMIMGTLETMFGVEQNSLADLPIEKWAEYLFLDGKPRKNLIFTVSVAQAKMMSDIFNRVKPGISAWVCGDVNLVSEARRDEIGTQFEKGDLLIVCNCGVYSEGYDNPNIQMITMARPTKSKTLFTQQIGRGTRILDGVIDGISDVADRLAAIAASSKPSMLVLDFVGNCGKHKLVSAVDLLGTKYSDDAKIRARKKAEKSSKPQNMSDLLRQSQAELEAEKLARDQAEAARRARLVAKATYSTTATNPFDRYGVKKNPPSSWEKRNGISLSEKQRAIIKRLGENPDAISVSCARKLIGAYFAQSASEPCTPNQAYRLRQIGKDPAKFNKTEASKAIGEWYKQQEQPPSNVVPIAEGKAKFDEMREALL